MSSFKRRTNKREKKEKKEKAELERALVKPTTRIVHADALGPSLPSLTILYTSSVEEVKNWMEIHAHQVKSHGLEEDVAFFGFDTETKPCFTKEAAMASRGPDTIQLAKPDGHCLVAHISHMRSDAKNDNLVVFQVLNDEIVKAGVSIDQDALELYKNYGLRTKCRLELSHMALDLETFLNNVVGGERSQDGLKKLCERFIPEMSIPKQRRLQMSNWSLALSDKQIEYAAVDAFAGAILCEILIGSLRNSSSHHLKDILLQSEVAIEDLEEERLRRKREKRRLQRKRRKESKQSEMVTTAA